MPTYEFRCPNGHGFERFYKTISAAPSEIACPDCGVAALRQLSGGAGLLFKGSGFYLTDYGKNAHRNAVPEKKGDAKSDAGTGKAEAPAAPESKTGSKPKDGSGAASPKPQSSTKPKKE